jgi:glycosyltransferase involved in cell wall biosynthesis
MRRTLWLLGSRLPTPVRRLVKSIPGSAWLRGLAAGNPKGPVPRSGDPRPVVYLPTWAQWDVMRQRPQFLLEAFATAGHPVYFVDPRESTERSADGVTIVPSLASVPGEHVILYIHFAPLRELIDRFTDAVVVYDILDDLTIYEADEIGLPTERTVAHHHPFLVERADEMIVSNPVLLHRHGNERGGVLLVENGVDSTRFATAQSRPVDLAEMSQPVIGYRGAVGDWFDFELLEAVAERKTGWRFVVVGPIYDRVADQASRLSQLANVDFLGERRSDEMPAYAQAFDVEAIWFVVNDMTSGVTPLKMFEALAAGTPVVGTPLPSCVEESTVRTAADPAAFRAALEGALSDASDPSWLTGAARAAADADWDNRIRPLLDRLDEKNQRLVP